VKLRDLTELAARNLREAVLRNLLTTLGIAVGVASLVAMLSLGVGLQNMATERLSRSGLFNAIYVTPQSAARRFGEASFTPDNAARHPLDEEARKAIEHLPNVLEAYPEIRFTTEIRFENKPYMTMVAGVPQSSRGNASFDGMTGAFFSGPEANEAILQIEFAKQLASQPDSLIGKQIVLRYGERQALPAQASAKGSADAGLPAGFSVIPREARLRIVGIVETEPGGFGGFGRGRVLIPLARAETLRAAQGSDLRELVRGSSARAAYENLTVRVADATDVKAAEGSIKDMGFAAFSLLDAAHNLSIVFVVFDLLLGIFGSLALVVASLGIINTLVMAILERRREIGVLKALGAADRDVKRLFFAEAGVMGLIGGIAGVFGGWLIGRALAFGTNIYLHRRGLGSANISAVPWWIVIGAIAFAVAVSLIAGMYPASRAAQLNPVEALRYE